MTVNTSADHLAFIVVFALMLLYSLSQPENMYPDRVGSAGGVALFPFSTVSVLSVFPVPSVQVTIYFVTATAGTGIETSTDTASYNTSIVCKLADNVLELAVDPLLNEYVVECSNVRLLVDHPPPLSTL